MKNTLFFICLILFFNSINGQSNEFLTLEIDKNIPLQQATIQTSKSGKIQIIDGNGISYFSGDISKELTFTTGGSLGNQLILLTDDNGQLLDTYSFNIDCKTEINDSKGKYKNLLDILYNSMTKEWRRNAGLLRYNNKSYNVFVPWLRDHVHTLKGMKYFYPKLKSGIDLYGDSQREDGMIWDNYTHKYDEEIGSYWVQRFKYGNFVMTSPHDGRLFTRIPTENDVEYLFIEGLYYTWKATGDDNWMSNQLDKALKAINYSTTNEYRWSDKYQLLKRGYTIDTWDFQNDIDADVSTGEGVIFDGMIVKTDKTRFGVMFGDNTGMIAACGYLTEMLRFKGRENDALIISKLGEGIKGRLNKLAWNGKFYTHHISEDKSIKRDFGIDPSTQISLSNAYSINRGISHNKAVNIIKTYLEIKEKMPKTSPGEFYTIYPPFEKGYESHTLKWDYMNGGVTSIVAGELAHGAFQHGYENYGVDILNRMLELAQSTDNYLHATYKGKIQSAPNQVFENISIKSIANTDFTGESVDGVMGWFNEGDYSLDNFPTGKRIFKGVPFAIINPLNNARKACLGISSVKGYAQHASLTVNRKAESIYFLHTANKNAYSGFLTIQYDDGTNHLEDINKKKVLSMWYPHIKQTVEEAKQSTNLKIAWKGSNSIADHIGVCIYGLNNPYPDKKIKNIIFISSKNGNKWIVLGVTISDHQVYFQPSKISTGIPDNWGAAAVVYALVEGLSGIEDKGVAFDNVSITPRWEFANETQSDVTIKYPASDGYVSYQYQKNSSGFNIVFTGTMKKTKMNINIPFDSKVSSVILNNKEVVYKNIIVEKSRYISIDVNEYGVHSIEIILL